MIREFIAEFFFGGKLIVKRIEDAYVEINHAFGRLYGLEIISNIERVKHVPKETLYKLHASPGNWDKYIYIAILKEKIGDYYFHRVYYFSPNPNIIETLASDFSSINCKKMTGLEIASTLIKLIHQNKSFTVNPETGDLYENMEYFNQHDRFVYDKWMKLINEVDSTQYRAFIGASYLGYPELNKLFKHQWEGVVWITINVNNQEPFIKSKHSQAVKNRKVFEKMRDMARSTEVLYSGVCIMFISKHIESDDQVVNIFNSLGFTYIEKKYLHHMFVTGTPILARDFDYFFQLRPENTVPYLFYTFEKSRLPKVAEVFGKNRYGSFVAFSSFEENDNPHILVFAPSGAGKSFNMQNMISQILRIDVDKLMEKKQEELRKDVRIRYFDKGFSAELFFKAMKANNLPVELFSARIDEISYNICEIEDESDYELSLQIVNTALLELGFSEPIIEHQANKYIEALRFVKTHPEYNYLRKEKISILATDEYRQLHHVYDELRTTGYRDDDFIGQIKEERFDFLKQPLIADVIRLLDNRKADQTYTERERRSMEELIAKLKVIHEQQPLRIPTQIPIKNSKVTYLEYEFLAESKLFVPVMLAIFKRLIKEDKFRKHPDEKAYYIVDEAHNLFRNQYFDRAMRILVREARKYRMSTVFLTQEFQEMPREVITNANTHMFIAPQEAERRRTYITGFYQHMGEKLDEKSDLYYVYTEIPARTFCIAYNAGVFSLVLDVNDSKLKLFDSYRKEIALKDGTILRKSSAMEE